MKKETEFKVYVYGYKGLLFFCPTSTELMENVFYPTGDGRMGCVLINSKNLYVNKEALKIMSRIPIGSDDIGDIDWWVCTNGKWAFSWWGHIFRVLDPATSVTARGFSIQPQTCNMIKGRVPKEIVNAYKTFDKEECKWKE